jgi:hypothetical protein
MNADAVFRALESVVDEASFIHFVEALAAEREASEALLETPDGFRGEWANQSIGQFLTAGASWARDSQFGMLPGPKPSNPWRLFAMFLWAGRGYE